MLRETDGDEAYDTMTSLKRIQAKALELARSGTFYGSRPIEFELLFEDGISEAREWLHRNDTQEELNRICQKARKRRLGAQGQEGKAPLAQ
jgi:hypothetical protein